MKNCHHGYITHHENDATKCNICNEEIKKSSRFSHSTTSITADKTLEYFWEKTVGTFGEQIIIYKN